MAMTIEVIQTENKPCDSMDLAINSGGRRLALGERFLKDGYSAIYWHVNPLIAKSQYIRMLADFYAALKKGGYKAIDGKGFPPGIDIGWITLEREVRQHLMPLEDLTAWERSIVGYQHYHRIASMRVNTPYADFAMERFDGNPWDARNGTLGVMSHQPLGLPLARLVADSACVPVKAAEIRPKLDDIFTF